MTSSPYAQVGPKLVDQGFSAIPCRPGSKIPGVYRGGKWFNELGLDPVLRALADQH